MKNKILLGLCAGITAAVAFTIATFNPREAHGQAATIQQEGTGSDRSAGDWTFSSVNVQPNAGNNPSNAFRVYDSTGTNWFGINPTNAQPQMQMGGTNISGISTNIINTNNIGTQTFVFRNGILIQVRGVP